MMKHPTVRSQISSLKPAVSWVAVTWAANTLIVTLGYQRMYHVYSAHWPFPGYMEKGQVTRSVFHQDSAAGGGGHSSAPCGTCIRTFPAYPRDYTWLQMFSAAASWPMCLPISHVALTLGTQFIFNIWFYSFNKYSVQFSHSVVSNSSTPWTAARQASLSITNSQSPPKPMSIELVMPSNHLILSRPLLLLPSIFPSISVFSNELVLRIRWPKY